MSVEEGEEKAREMGVLFIETSAKAGYNIKPLFQKLATTLPGADTDATAASTKASNLIDITIDPTTEAGAEGAGAGANAGCGC